MRFLEDKNIAGRHLLPASCWPRWPAFHDMTLTCRTCCPALREAVPRAEELFGCAINSLRLGGGQLPVLLRRPTACPEVQCFKQSLGPGIGTWRLKTAPVVKWRGTWLGGGTNPYCSKRAWWRPLTQQLRPEPVPSLSAARPF